MRIVLLTIVLMFVFQICTAPVNDFELKIHKIRSLLENADRRHHESEFSRFINDLGYRESENNWLSVNLIGCFGEWQFAESTLRVLGFKKITLKRFRANPNIFPREMQLEALKELIRINLNYLKNYEHFIGDTINGVVITKSGMIAASHLGGAGTLIEFLNSKGKINRKDIFGTSIYDYVKRFSAYDLE
jgi:hypothetical protein